MFKKFVGEMAYENVAIATIMWWEGEGKVNVLMEHQLEVAELGMC
jgi:hypothetical protein